MNEGVSSLRSYGTQISQFSKWMGILIVQIKRYITNRKKNKKLLRKSSYNSLVNVSHP